jgi:hypothetical protein
MRFWCQMLNIDEDIVSERVMEALEDGRPISYKRSYF